MHPSNSPKGLAGRRRARVAAIIRPRHHLGIGFAVPHLSRFGSRTSAPDSAITLAAIPPPSPRPKKKPGSDYQDVRHLGCLMICMDVYYPRMRHVRS